MSIEGSPRRSLPEVDTLAGRCEECSVAHFHALLPLAASTPPPSSRGFFAYALASVLGVVALYLFVRLLIWDRVNEETPNQEEPVFREREEPARDER